MRARIRVVTRTVGGSGTDLTAPTPPAPQSLASTATTASLTWTHASAPGGTTYVLTAVDEGGSSVSASSGSGLGPYVLPVASGQSYIARLTATGTDGQTAQSSALVVVASALGEWEMVSECDFTDANWTALSSTDATRSTTAWQHVLYAADGTTPRAYVLNDSGGGRVLSIAPSSGGLELANSTSANNPTIGVWPANWTSMLGGSRADLWMIEAVCEVEEPAGSGALVHFLGIATGASAVVSPSTGIRVTQTSANLLLSAASYANGFSTSTVATVTAGATRLARWSIQLVIGDARRLTGYITVGSTSFQDPEGSAADRIRYASASTAITSVDGEDPVSATWVDATILGRTKMVMYHDGTAASGSAVRCRKLRLLRIAGGSH